MNRSEIGYCVWILHKKLWGKIQFNGQLKSKNWWQNRLQVFINEPEIKITEFWECRTAEPIPYEVEFNLSNKPDCDA